MADIKVLIAEINGTELGLHEERDLQAVDTTVSPAVEGQTKVQETLEELADGLREYHYYENETTFTTNSSIYQLIDTLTTGPLRGGKYIVAWYYETSPTSSDKPAEVLVQTGATVLGDTVGGSLVFAWADNGGMKEVTLAAGVHNIDLSIKRYSNKAVSIRRRRLALWRVNGV